MYAGNIGLYYDFATVLDAAETLSNNPNVVFAIVGDGGAKDKLREIVACKKLSNVVFFPYQPASELNDVLNSCDATLVSIAPTIEGISFPSKLYSSLAIGKPVLAVSPANSHLRTVIEERCCGLWAENNDGKMLADNIEALLRLPEAGIRTLGNNARHAALEYFSKDKIVKKYKDLLDRLSK